MPAELSSLDHLLDYVKRTRGFDFTGYKRTSLERRFTKRMDEVGVKSQDEYLDYLEVHPDEFARLFNTILINVTDFFRDPPAWEHLADQVLPDIVKSHDGEIRVWCAGCATGEEAYTTAMLLAETLGEDVYRQRVKIYATDVDEEALTTARHGVYSPDQVKAVPEELQERYFERVDHRYAFRPDLRRTVIFGRNDLVQDAPISRIDLLTCRNTLMYFTAETQTHILERFHFALRDAGAMLLGKSEMLITHSELFLPLDLKRRIFRRVPRRTLRDRYAFVAQADGDNGLVADAAGASVRDGAVDGLPMAQLVVDADGTLVYANQAARSLLAITRNDIGRPFHDHESSFKPVDLRSGLEQAYQDRRPVSLGQVNLDGVAGANRRTLDATITPVLSRGRAIGASIVFADVTAQRRLQDELERSKRELEIAYEELQSTVEELETTNEELQSTNEELETTNEELQSTNEELETMNEELQSTNEELETTNDELRSRGTELDRVNAFLDTILSSMGVAVAVVDGEQRVQVWNRNAEQFWGLRTEEVEGQHVLSLDIGLPVEQLKQPLRAALAGKVEEETLVLDAVNRRGKPLRCQVRILPLGGGEKLSGAILLMEEAGPER